MAVVDLAIAFVVAAAVLVGFIQGFLRSFCSLGGLLLGLGLAAWNYGTVAKMLMPLVQIRAAADATGFLLIALVVMIAANLVGSLLSKVVHGVGLGCLDRLAGGAFGFLQGTLLVSLCILVTVAFFPQAGWLTQARLPRMFFGACHLSTHMSPAELSARVRAGLNQLEHSSPGWMHPDGTGL